MFESMLPRLPISTKVTVNDLKYLVARSAENEADSQSSEQTCHKNSSERPQPPGLSMESMERGVLKGAVSFKAYSRKEKKRSLVIEMLDVQLEDQEATLAIHNATPLIGETDDPSAPLALEGSLLAQWGDNEHISFSAHMSLRSVQMPFYEVLLEMYSPQAGIALTGIALMICGCWRSTPEECTCYRFKRWLEKKHTTESEREASWSHYVPFATSYAVWTEHEYWEAEYEEIAYKCGKFDQGAIASDLRTGTFIRYARAKHQALTSTWVFDPTPPHGTSIIPIPHKRWTPAGEIFSEDIEVDESTYPWNSSSCPSSSSG